MNTDVRVAEQAWLDDEGFYSLPETLSLLDTSADRIKQLIQDDRLFVIRGPENNLHVPAFQFDDGQLLPHLPEVLQALPTRDPVAVGAFLTHPPDDPRYEKLRNGEVESVINEAEQLELDR